MQRFSGNKGSKMGYQKSPINQGSGSRMGKSPITPGSSSRFGSKMGYQKSPSSPAFQKDQKITLIRDIDPMLDNISVQGRCVSIWHSHKLNEAHNPYSLDLVLQDAQNDRIQIYIKKDLMFRFEPLFEEGQCYVISNFGVAENSGRLPLLPHKYKLSFFKGTQVTRVDPFDENVNGLILEPFNSLLDGNRHYHDHEAVDVIGSVIAIGDIVPVQSAAGPKIRRTVVIEDEEGIQLDCTFWDTWAKLWDEYASKRETMGHVVFVLQLGKVKYWDGTPAVHNALFGSKIYINRDIPEITKFKTRLQERADYDETQFKIELFAPVKPVVTIAEFFHGAVKNMIGGIRECEQESHCIILATIHKFQKESGWAYTACKECNKKVDVLESKGPSSSKNRKPTFICEDHGQVPVASRFKVIMRIIDESGSAPVLFFNSNFHKLSSYTAWELMEKHGMDVDEYWPDDLDKLVGKKLLFKIFFSDYNINKNHHIYRCDAFSEDPELIKHFKHGFLEDEDDQEFTTPASLIKSTNFQHTSSSRVLDMNTPDKAGNASGSKGGGVDMSETEEQGEDNAGSAQSSGGDRKRVFIDLDDLSTNIDGFEFLYHEYCQVYPLKSYTFVILAVIDKKMHIED